MSLFELYEVKRLAKNGSKWKHKMDKETILTVVDDALIHDNVLCVVHTKWAKHYQCCTLSFIVENYEPI